MTKATIAPKKISQLHQGEHIKNSKGKSIKSPSACPDGNANPSYHPWEASSLDNFLSGKKIQCGKKSTYHCNLKTVKWIKGYRNTCPIAGCCGTFNKPAPLVLSNFNFKEKKIAKKIKISKISVSYKHHLTGVDVGVGKGSETNSWGGYFPHVDLILYKNNTKIDSVRHNKQVPLAKNSTVSVTFNKDIKEFNPSSDKLKIEIHYAANGDGDYYKKATNPSIIYATGLDIEMDYEYLEQPKIATISSGDGQATLITDPRMPTNSAGSKNCRTTFTHTIKYTNTTANDIIVTVPDGVEYTSTQSGNQVQYTYQDTSGKAGTKSIKYTLKSNKSQEIEKKYIAQSYTRPTIKIVKDYIKNQLYRPQDTFISISNKCWNNIKIYVDGNQKLLISWNNATQNIAMPSTINQEELLNRINALSCGLHILNIFIDDVFYQETQIQIVPPQIMLEATLQGEYKQDKRNPHIPVEITRTDSIALQNPIDVTIIDTAEKEMAPQTISLEPHETKTQQVNVYKLGVFELQYSYDDGCKTVTKSFGEYTVTPTHVQSYDNLLIRSETPIEYESIVVRRGDAQTQPVTYTDANLKQSMDDIVLFGKDGRCALGDLGHGILAIKNNSQDTIYNFCIELNPLITSEDENEDFNPLIMEWKTGMLQNFDTNFYILNPQFKSSIDILNTKHYDFINEGTENVVLCIKEIKPGDENVMEIKIPYSSSYAQEIFMNFLLLGEPTDFIDLDNNIGFENNDSFYQQDSYDESLFASHTSKQSERNCMCISLKTIDMLSAELYIDGEDLDRNDIVNTDDLDIKYTIQMSSLDCDGYSASSLGVQTEIKNDIELIPTGYLIDGERKDFDATIVYDNDNNIVKRFTENNPDGIDMMWGIQSDIINDVVGEDIYLRYLDINDNVKYIRAKTDEDGYAKLSYIIPDYQQNNANINEKTEEEYHLKDILKHVDIFYPGNNFYNEAILQGQEINNDIPKTQIQIWGFVYYQLNQDPVFVDINNLQDRNISSIYNIYIVGQLIEQDSQNGINDEIITANIKYGNSTIVSQGITTTNTSDLFGSEKENANGFFKIKINKKLTGTAQYSYYNLRQIYNSRYVSYDGDLWHQKSDDGFESNSIAKEKYQPTLKYINDYNIYRRGETINIKVHLSAPQEKFVNTITIQHDLVNCGQAIHIFYQPCTTENTKGFKTVFKTKSENIIPNQVEKLIYCGVKTDLKILAKLQKKIIENHNVNVLTLNAINGYKPNQNVIVKALIGPEAQKQRLGDYLALSAIDIDKEKYSYDRSSDIVYWKIGDMESYETQTCNILLEGENIGHNTIYVCGFDYLNPDIEKIIPTELTLESEDNNEFHYIDDSIVVKAKLIAPETQQNLYGQIYFDIRHYSDYEQVQNLTEYINALQCVLHHNEEDFNEEHKTRIEELLDKTDIFETDLSPRDTLAIESEIKVINEEIESLIYQTKAQAQVITDNNEYYALAHVKLTDSLLTTVQAYYEGAQMLSLTYEPSTSNTLTYDNINKYDTVLKLRCEQEDIKTNQNIQIIGSVAYKDESETYFDADLGIRFIVNNQELHNIEYVDNEYVVNFAVTQAGEYTIQAFIPNTYKTEESSDKIIIEVGENND